MTFAAVAGALNLSSTRILWSVSLNRRNETMDDSTDDDSEQLAVDELSLWLQESKEFGMAPKSISVVESYEAPWPWEPEDQEIHLVQFVLPNGREGVGVAGPIAYSFSDRDIDFSLFEHDELLKLYAGWYLLFELMESESYQPTFSAEEDEAMVRMLEDEHGLTEVQIVDRVQIDDQRFFEMTGLDKGQPCRIGGSFDGCFSFYPDDKFYGLPALYYVMGWVFYSDDDDEEDEEDDDDEESDDEE